MKNTENKNIPTKKRFEMSNQVETNLTNEKHDERKLYTILTEDLVKYLISLFEEKMEAIRSRPRSLIASIEACK